MSDKQTTADSYEDVSASGATVSMPPISFLAVRDQDWLLRAREYLVPLENHSVSEISKIALWRRICVDDALINV
jgi:hypothetical protein